MEAAAAAGYRSRRVLALSVALSVLFMLAGFSLGLDGYTSSRSGIGGVGTPGLPPETSRRVLHEPLFPMGEPPAPAPAPAPAVPVVEPPPRIPFTNQPFFPLSTPPPPPDLPSVTGLPANPRQDLGSKGGGSGRKKNVVIGVVVSLCAIVVLWGLIVFLHSRRKRRREEAWVAHNVFLDETPLRGEGAQNSGGGSENLRVFQAAAPVTAKLAVNGGSDFLYLGTMDPRSNTHLSSNGDRDRDRDRDRNRDVQSVNDDTHVLHNTRNSNFDEKNNDVVVGGAGDNDDKGNPPKFRMPNGGVVDQFQRRRSSPEVHPLPPLAKRPPSHHRTSVCSDSSDDESFYSPKGASSTSSRSNNDSSSPRMSVCKRLFPSSPPKEQQQPSIVSLKSESTHSYPSSSKTSSPASSPSPLNSPPSSSPSPLASPPSPPITPTVLPPPIRSHLHSNESSPHHYPPPRRNPPLPPNAETRPPVASAPIHQFKAPSPPVSHQSKISRASPAGHQSNIPPPPPLPPRPLFQFPRISPSTEPKPHPNSFPATPPKENTSFSLPHSSPAREKSNSKSSSSTPLPNRVSPYSSPMREKSVSQSPSSTASSRKSHSSLPPLPTRPTPPFLSSSRSGRQSQSPLRSSNCPPPPPPPDALSPLPSRPSYRPHSGLYSTRMGQPLQSLSPTSDHSPEQQNTPSSDGTPRPKLKPLHWDKVRASPDRAMVWDQLKSGSFKLNEEMIETLFVYNTPTPVKGETTKRSVTPPQNQRLLDSKKSQNIAILLRALSVTKDEVCDALLEGTSDNLSTELLETLSKMEPSKDEEIRLKAYNGDASKLGPAERFLKALLDIPFAFKRIDAMLYRANFKEEINYIRNSFKTLEAACEELRSSRLFLKLLEAVLKTGNRMNVGTIRGDAQAFKLDTLLKLVDVKGTDGKTTLLHFVVQEIIKAEGMRVASTDEQPLTDSTCDTINDKLDALSTEGKSQKDKEDDYKKIGLQVVAGLSTEMANVKKAAGVDSDALSMSVSKLATGLGKLREILQTDVTRQTKDGNVDGSSKEGNFYRAIESFLEQANEDIRQVQDEEKKAFSRVKEITEYFHGDAAKEEAHPLRFFVVVRDFLSVLDQVCREIGRTQTKNTQGSIRPNPISAPISVPISVPVSSHAFSRPLPRGYYDRRPDFDTSSDGSSSP